MTRLMLVALLLGGPLGCAEDGGWGNVPAQIDAEIDMMLPDMAPEPDAATTDDAALDGSAGPMCLGDTCATHDDCKADGCEATFCMAVLQAFRPDTPGECAMRCSTADDCLEGQTCNTQVALLGAAADGADGICVASEE